MEQIKRPITDKSKWGNGPWINEPDRKEWRDEATGFPCLAIRHPRLGHWCGYVAVAPGHPAHGKDYDSVDVNAHGGLTYASACSGDVCHVPPPGEPDDVWWLGFDCAHAWDLSPSCHASLPAHLRSGEDVYRDLPYVERECADLAQQLLAMIA